MPPAPAGGGSLIVLFFRNFMEDLHHGLTYALRPRLELHIAVAPHLVAEITRVPAFSPVDLSMPALCLNSKQSLLFPFLFLPQVHGPVREGDLDPFLVEPLKDPFPELMLDKVLVHKFLDLADKGKVQRTVAEAGNETHKGLRFRQE